MIVMDNQLEMAHSTMNLPQQSHISTRKASRKVSRWAALSGVLLTLAAALSFSAPAEAAPKSLDALLKQVKAGWTKDKAENKKRVAKFRSSRNEQKALLAAAKAKFAKMEREGEVYEAAFTANEILITKEEETLRLRLGTMGELFGVIRQVAGDSQAELKTSLVSAQFPGREKNLIKLATSKELPKVAELNALWFALQKEMVEQGKVVKFKAVVTNADGEQAERDVIRVGVFNVVSDGKYLDWIPEVGSLVELSPQPAGYSGSAEDLQEAYGTGEFTRFGLDFTRGAILRALVQSPSFVDRMANGGTIGYMIIIMGIMAMLFGLFRFAQLSLVGVSVTKQRSNLEVPDNSNPLGRILTIYKKSASLDAESLEHRLDEAVMGEVSRLESFLWIVKIVQIVAPLMGLLGTVTGMIKTFQAITLFGTGDPKRMAGGISEALVTTMLGLIVAISLVFLNSWLKTLSKRVTDILDQQSAGLVAQRAEKEEQDAGMAQATV